MATKVLGVLRDAVAFGIYFAGVALEATARRMTDAIEAFEKEDLGSPVRCGKTKRETYESGGTCRRPYGHEGPCAVELPDDPYGEPPRQGPAGVTLSRVALEMLADGRRRTETQEPRTGPLAGSVAARFARRA